MVMTYSVSPENLIELHPCDFRVWNGQQRITGLLIRFAIPMPGSSLHHCIVIWFAQISIPVIEFACVRSRISRVLLFRERPQPMYQYRLEAELSAADSDQDNTLKLFSSRKNIWKSPPLLPSNEVPQNTCYNTSFPDCPCCT